MGVLMAPVFGESPVMLGAPVTVNWTPPLCTPPAAVTTTLPVVAPAGTDAVMLLLLQELMLAAEPLNVTLPLPWDAPKFDPAITMEEVIAPAFGERLVMLGAPVTVNKNPLL